MKKMWSKFIYFQPIFFEVAVKNIHREIGIQLYSMILKFMTAYYAHANWLKE